MIIVNADRKSQSHSANVSHEPVLVATLRLCHTASTASAARESDRIGHAQARRLPDTRVERIEPPEAGRPSPPTAHAENATGE
jgi:hypothetical protein